MEIEQIRRVGGGSRLSPHFLRYLAWRFKEKNQEEKFWSSKFYFASIETYFFCEKKLEFFFGMLYTGAMVL